MIRTGPLRTARMRERFTCLGYLYTPVSLFSLFLGLSMPTFGYLASVGFPPPIAEVTRSCLLAIGGVWSASVALSMLQDATRKWRVMWGALLPQWLGVALVLALWWPILKHP